MIRTVDNVGAIYIGFTHAELRRLVVRLLEGERVCLPGHVDGNGLRHPHVCLVCREDNRALVELQHEHFPDGPLPGCAFEHVSKESPV